MTAWERPFLLEVRRLGHDSLGMTCSTGSEEVGA